MVNDTRITIASDVDVVSARQLGREIAERVGFTPGDQTVIAAAISEIARNVLTYARTGDITLTSVTDNGVAGVIVVARDKGPGIPDVPLALQEGYSTSGGLGLGLPGARRLMDDFILESTPGEGP